MRELDQEFLLLPRWRTIGCEGIAAPAELVRSAAVVLPAFRGGDRLDGVDASYLLGGQPVVHSIVGDLAALRPGEPGNAALAGVRPVFSWVSADEVGLARAVAGALPPEVVIVTPAELASLARQYHGRMTRRKVPLVRAGATWKYHDKGEDLGEKWRALDFEDSAWSEGPAELGYGDGGAEKTLLSFGEDASSKHLSTYFRHSFEVADVGVFRQIFLRVLRDDGCVVYLNGREAARSNMPEGEVGFATTATSAIGGSAENTWVAFALESRLLRRGTNVVAVEMHQSSGTSSDLSFDLELTGYEETRNEEAPTDGQRTSRGAFDPDPQESDSGDPR